ncbi:slipin family protein [Candidatus Woesearchaeota archaeon]|nr:slipin family protein [Candidatus Woesearchaeota archaeon]
MVFEWIIAVIVVLFVLTGLKVVNQYERGVKFTLGKFARIMDPGLRLVVPVFQSWERVDIRVKAVDVPSQECISKDNVSVKVDAVLYYKVNDPKKAVIEIQQFNYAVSQLAQTTIRNIIGQFELDGILQKREEISKRIEGIVEKETTAWGVSVEKIDIKNVELPPELKRMMSAQAESEREKRAVIIKAEGEVIAADNMAKAAKTLSAADGALHLRTLQTIDDISSDQSNTVVFLVPLEILRAFDGMKKK